MVGKHYRSAFGQNGLEDTCISSPNLKLYSLYIVLIQNALPEVVTRV